MSNAIRAIAAASVIAAQPDGYTIFIHHNGMATATGLYRKLPFNPLTDFEYIGQVADVPMTLLAKKDLPPDNLRELIAYVRLNKEIVPESKQTLAGLRDWLKSEIDKWQPVIRKAGVYAD